MVNANDKKTVSFDQNKNKDGQNQHNNGGSSSSSSSLLNNAKPSFSPWIKNANGTGSAAAKETATGGTSSSSMYDSAFAHSPSFNRRATLENALGNRGILCGIKNIGATCYAASLLQTMFVTPELRSHVICYPFAEKQRHKDNIAYQLQLLFAQMQGRRKAYVDPTNLLLSFNMGPGAHTQQHDVQELNRQLVDVIQGFIDRTPATAAAIVNNSDNNNNNDAPSSSSVADVPQNVRNEVIKDLYRFYIGDVKKCLGCNTVTHSGGQVFLDISLPIANKETLERALEDYVRPDLIEGASCEHCKGPQNLQKGAVFESFPKVFSIHLLRFDFNLTTFRREKVESELNLPISLDVNRLLFKTQSNTSSEDAAASSSSQQEQQQQIETDIDYQYEINSVICHRGTPFHGHYYCFVRVAETEEELEEILYGKEQAKIVRENRSKKQQEIQLQETEARRLIGCGETSSWVKFDDDKVTIAEPDEVLSYVLPTVWKERREKLKLEKEAKDEEERKKKKEEEDEKKKATANEDAAEGNNTTTTSSSVDKTTNETENVSSSSPIVAVVHPLAADAASTQSTTTEITTTDALSKLNDEEAIADIFCEAFGGMVESNAGSANSSSKTNYEHLTKVSGHSYYVLYRRKDIALTPIVKVTDVFTMPKQEIIPEYVKSVVNKDENELAEKANELEQLKDIVSVAIWDANTKKRTWIDVTEDITIADLTKLAYDTIYPKQEGKENNNQQQQQQQQQQPVTQDSAPPSSSLNQKDQQQSKDSNIKSTEDSSSAMMMMPLFDPSLARLRKYSTSHCVGGATFSNPSKETLASLGFKKTSSQHAQFLLETRKSVSEVQWRDVKENDLSLRVAKLTRNTPLNVPITEYQKLVLSADSNLVLLYQRAAELYKVADGMGNVQLTLRRDGEAMPLAIWEPKAESVVNMGAKQSSGDAFVLGLFADTSTSATNSDNNKNNNGILAAAENSSQVNDQIDQDAKLARELSNGQDAALKTSDGANNNNNKDEKNSQSQQQQQQQQQTSSAATIRKPFYRDLEATTLKHIDLCQDDVIFVEEFQQFNLPSEASELRSKLIAVEFTDYQYLVKVFWTVSGFDDSLIPSSIDRKAPVFVDKRKTLLEMKDKICSTLCLFGANNHNNNQPSASFDYLSECQMLLDGGVREPKSLASTTIRSATYGMGSVNVEIRKGRPLQESECFVTVFKTTEDYLKNPVEQIKRVLIKGETTLFALAQAAFDSSFPNEGACGVEAARENDNDTEQQHVNNEDDANLQQNESSRKQQQRRAQKPEEKCVPQAGGGSTRVTSVCIDGQHYRPRLMPSGTTVKSWGSPMYKREVKANLSNPHVIDNSEIRVVFQPVEQEEALTKSSLLLRFHRWNAMAPDVSASLSLPGHNVVLPKDGPIESILDVFGKLSPEIPQDNIEFGRCRAYQMRSQENICNDLMWLSKSFIDMESGKKRTLCGHPMKFESDEIVLYRDSDESWPSGVNVQFGFSAVQSNSQQKDILSKSSGKGGKDGGDDDGKSNKKKASAEKGISLRVVWDEESKIDDEDKATADGASGKGETSNKNNNKKKSSSKNKDDDDAAAAVDKNDKNDDDNDSTKENADENPNNSRENSSGADAEYFMSEDEILARKLQQELNGGDAPLSIDAAPGSSSSNKNSNSNNNINNKQGSVAASVGVSDSELINFVPHEPYSELMKISLPTQCCICFCDFEDNEAVCVTKCHHIIHRECLAPWLAQEFTCPQCKSSLW